MNTNPLNVHFVNDWNPGEKGLISNLLDESCKTRQPVSNPRSRNPCTRPYLPHQSPLDPPGQGALFI